MTWTFLYMGGMMTCTLFFSQLYNPNRNFFIGRVTDKLNMRIQLCVFLHGMRLLIYMLSIIQDIIKYKLESIEVPRGRGIHLLDDVKTLTTRSWSISMICT